MGSHGSAERFRRALRELDRNALGRFVADLWTARGWEAGWHPEAGVVTAGRDGAETVRIAVRPSGRWRRLRARGVDPAAVDAVVAIGPSLRWPWTRSVPPEVERIGAEGLRERLRYGLEPEDADRLIERHLGDTTPGRGRRRPGARWSIPAGPVRSPRALGTLLLLVLAGSMLTVAAPGVPDVGSALGTQPGDAPLGETPAEHEPWRGIPPADGEGPPADRDRLMRLTDAASPDSRTPPGAAPGSETATSTPAPGTQD